MTAFNLGDTVQFADSVVKRLGHDAECANARGTVVGWCGPSAVKVDFAGTWIPHEDGSTVRAVPRRNLQTAAKNLRRQGCPIDVALIILARGIK